MLGSVFAHSGFVKNAYRSSKLFQKKCMLSKILRVDHAGELGADKIYSGQLLMLKNQAICFVVRDMWAQEQDHLKKFEELILQYSVRPSALLSFWNLAGFTLGAGTAYFGNESAMTCTVAVEKIITEHYESQIRELMEENSSKHKKILNILKKFRDDEQHHHDIGIYHGAERTIYFQNISRVIEKGCSLAIATAERV